MWSLSPLYVNNYSESDGEQERISLLYDLLNVNICTPDDVESFFIYAGARSLPMSGDVTYIISSLVGWDLAQPYIYIKWNMVAYFFSLFDSSGARFQIDMAIILCRLPGHKKRIIKYNATAYADNILRVIFCSSYFTNFEMEQYYWVLQNIRFM